MPRIMMVAGEASGDLHGGALASALFEKDPSLEIIGIGGNAMRRAGVAVRFDISAIAVVGIVEVLRHAAAIWQAYRLACKLISQGIDVLVLIDYPDFNLRLAKWAKHCNVPVVYYIGPQVWAWRPNRMHLLRERVNQMLVILPFEAPLYEAARLPCKFVGHPLLDHFNRGQLLPKADYLKTHGLNPNQTTIALLPGSREKEVRRLLPVMMAAMKLLVEERPTLQMIIPIASTLSADWMETITRRFSLPVRMVTSDDVYDVLNASDMAVVASGTATLQAALCYTPMVVVYKTSFLTYWMVKRLLRLSTIGLVNLVAKTPVVPELLQDDASPKQILYETKRLLEDTGTRLMMQQRLQEVAALLGEAGASHRAADAVYAIISPKETTPSPAKRERGREKG